MMSDDLVKQSLLELLDIVRCRCHPAYTGRGMHDPDCECDSVEAVKVVADRIEELEAKLRLIQEEWHGAVYGDLENGVESPHAKAAVKDFHRRYPLAANFGATINRIIDGGEDA